MALIAGAGHTPPRPVGASTTHDRRNEPHQAPADPKEATVADSMFGALVDVICPVPVLSKFRRGTSARTPAVAEPPRMHGSSTMPLMSSNVPYPSQAAMSYAHTPHAQPSQHGLNQQSHSSLMNPQHQMYAMHPGQVAGSHHPMQRGHIPGQRVLHSGPQQYPNGISPTHMPMSNV